MFKFLKDMLKPGKEEARLTFGIDEVAPFLETSLQDVTVSRYEKTNGPRQAVEIERQELHRLLDEISSKERDRLRPGGERGNEKAPGADRLGSP